MAELKRQRAKGRSKIALLPLLVAIGAIVTFPATRRAVTTPPEPGRVTLMRTPDGGVQPQAAVDRKGVIHLIYLKGDPGASDIYYSHMGPGASAWSRPLRVNSVPGSAIATGSVRGPQIAVGRSGRVYVAWMGSEKAWPRGPKRSSPMLFTRLNGAGTAFEPQRNVMQYATGLDGGSSIAADGLGNVYVVWHANPEANGEANRKVYIARSTDDGKTFGREFAADAGPTGACGCCGMRAFDDSRGDLYILFRTATRDIHRDMDLLVSRDHGRTFTGTRVGLWLLNACPMSTAFLSQGGGGVLAAWETAGQVYFDKINPSTFRISPAIAAPGPAGDRKHPAVVENDRGATLLAWTEGTAWQRGGSLAWQVFDEHGRPSGSRGGTAGVPVWGLVTAFARADGGFTIVY